MEPPFIACPLLEGTRFRDKEALLTQGGQVEHLVPLNSTQRKASVRRPRRWVEKPPPLNAITTAVANRKASIPTLRIPGLSVPFHL
ncbi:hypothetical protein CIB48_g9554 [Xylaria polymorpha]|nr:hypothetical protein CIB48_g9554 [Xylaria polymorpha]